MNFPCKNMFQGAVWSAATAAASVATVAIRVRHASAAHLVPAREEARARRHHPPQGRCLVGALVDAGRDAAPSTRDGGSGLSVPVSVGQVRAGYPDRVRCEPHVCFSLVACKTVSVSVACVRVSSAAPVYGRPQVRLDRVRVQRVHESRVRP